VTVNVTPEDDMLAGNESELISKAGGDVELNSDRVIGQPDNLGNFQAMELGATHR
jgi:hypothetical protein